MLKELEIYKELKESCCKYIRAIDNTQLDNMMIEEGKIRAYAIVLQDSNITIKYVNKDYCKKILNYIDDEIIN